MGFLVPALMAIGSAAQGAAPFLSAAAGIAQTGVSISQGKKSQKAALLQAEEQARLQKEETTKNTADAARRTRSKKRASLGRGSTFSQLGPGQPSIGRATLLGDSPDTAGFV